MAVQKQTELLQYNGDKKTPFKLVVSTKLETKIRTFCALSPDREWSGVLFYLFEGDFEKGITIRANDMYLMDQGSGAHTEFDLDAPEITRHLFMEGLMSHCMGLIHSHNQMKAFFSGEDRDTLITHGNHMHNFVFLVVNNEDSYVARLTRQVRFNGFEEKIVKGKSTSPLFNTDTVEEYEYDHHERTPINNSFLEYIDLEIIKEKPSLSEINAEIERFGEINSKCSYQKPIKLGDSPFDYSAKNFPTVNPQQVDWGNMKQGSLFEEETFKDNELVITKEIVNELKTIPWKTLGYDRWIAQLLYGSPFANYTDFNKSSIEHLNKLYKARFKNEMDFAVWFEVWIDFLLPDFDFPINAKFEFTDMDTEEALIYQTYMFISGKELVYKNVMLQSLLNRLI